MLCKEQGGFLFQAAPDLFPYGRLSGMEISLWSKYYEEQEANRGRSAQNN